METTAKKLSIKLRVTVPVATGPIIVLGQRWIVGNYYWVESPAPQQEWSSGRIFDDQCTMVIGRYTENSIIWEEDRSIELIPLES